MDGCPGTGIPASDTGRVTLQGIESVKREPLGVIFSFRYLNLAAGTRGDLDGDGGDHSLTCILVGTGVTVIEYVPLSVYLTYSAVGVAVHRGRCKGLALFVDLTSAAVNDCTFVCPGAERIVAVGVGKSIVR